MANAGVGRTSFYFPARLFFSLSGIGVALFLIVILKIQWLWLQGMLLSAVVNTPLSHAFLSLPALVALAVPLAFHAGMGLTLLARGRVNVWRYSYVGNWRYTLARIGGVIGVGTMLAVAGFLFWQQEALSTPLEPGKLLPEPWAWVWLIGSTALIAYLINGAVLSLLTWGVTVSRVSRKAALVLGTGVTVAAVSCNFILQAGFILETAAQPVLLQYLLARLTAGG